MDGVKSACEKVAEVMGEYLACRDAGFCAELFHIRPDIRAIERLSALGYENRSALYFFAFCVVLQHFAELFRNENDPSLALAIDLGALKAHRLDGDKLQLGDAYSRRTDRLHQQIKSAAFSFCRVEQAEIFGFCKLAVVAREELLLRFDEFDTELVAFAEDEEGIERG